MKIHILQDDCIACGACWDLLPEVFGEDDDHAIVLTPVVPPEHEDLAREAAEDCPTEAIEIDDQTSG